MAKNPASLFYWADWENDQELQACDIAAQGLWMRMLCIAARAREYGFVLIGEHPGTPEALAPILARTVGRTAKQVLAMIHELLRMGAASLDDRGWVYCRRMVRSVEVSAKRSAAANKRWHKEGEHASQDASQDAENLQCKSSSKPDASSRLQDSSTSNASKERDNNHSPGLVAAREAEFEAWYRAYPKRVGRGAAVRAYRTARKKADAATLLAAAERAAEQYAGTERQFIPNPATWLNGERWLDEGAVNGADTRKPASGNGWVELAKAYLPELLDRPDGDPGPAPGGDRVAGGE